MKNIQCLTELRLLTKSLLRGSSRAVHHTRSRWVYRSLIVRDFILYEYGMGITRQGLLVDGCLQVLSHPNPDLAM
jgi:hypothetical protein